MALATLSIDLEARLAKLQEGMDKAERIAAKTAAGIEARWGKLSSLASGIGAGLVAGFSGAALATFTRQTVDAVDALNDVKDATGASIENLSALEDVARRNGGTLDDVASILVKFNGQLKEADGKNGASQALKAIGLDAAALKREDPAEALRKVAVALAGYADDGTKARIVQELFGKSIKEAGPYLKDLAEQGRLNGSVTTKQAEEAEKFNKQLFAFQTNAGNAARSIVGEMLPALSKLAEAFERLGKNSAAAGAKFDVVKSSKELAEATRDLEFLQDRATNGPAATRGYYAGQIEAQREKVARLTKEAFRATDALKGLVGDGSKPGFNDRRDGNAKDALPGLPELGGGSTGKAPGFGAIRDAAGQYRADFLRSEKAAYTESEKAAIESFGAILDAKEQYKADFLKSEKDAYDTVATYAEKTVDTITDFAKRGQERLQDALGDTLFQALSGNFDDIGKAFGNLIKRMIAESLAADIMGALFGGAKGGSSGSNILGTVLAFFGGGRASGGPTSPGKMYEVNEQGTPELLEYGGREFLLSGKRSGYVRPLTAGGAGGAGTVISNDTYNIGQGVSAGQVAAAIKAANTTLEARIYRRMREGAPA